MIVRTYQRRNRNGTNNNNYSSSSNYGFSLSDSQEDEYLQAICGSNSQISSQDSISWDFKAAKMEGTGTGTGTTLMEAQESGEMMQHVDEANFALDGLRATQPVRIQRASLLSLLSIFTSTHRRRILRTQGMIKKVIDSIVSLSTNDTPTTLSASALLYILANDGQDEHLLDSVGCIEFLLKLLSPALPEVREKSESVGTRLLGLISNSGMTRTSSTIVDNGGQEIISKVQNLLLSTKKVHGRSNDEEEIRLFSSHELNSKWLALLTLEKACLSTVSLEDTSGSVRRVGGNFKERLRELGGVDTVCDVAQSCFGVLKNFCEDETSKIFSCSSKTSQLFQNVGLLLKCLKVMENATFLSERNQKHLLEMNLSNLISKLSFVDLVINSIKMLSDLLVKFSIWSFAFQKKEETEFLKQESHVIGLQSQGEFDSCAGRSIKATDSKLSKTSEELSNVDAQLGWEDIFRDRNGHSYSTCTSNGSDEHQETVDEGFHCSKRIAGSKNGRTKRQKCTGITLHGLTTVGTEQTCAETKQVKPNQSGLETKQVKSNAFNEESQDPYAFFDEALDPWYEKAVNGHKQTKSCKSSANSSFPKVKKRQKSRQKKTFQACASKSSAMFDNNDESTVSGDNRLVDYSQAVVSVYNHCIDRHWIDYGFLFGDCLLACIKVLMNLTNDNPLGCNHVAASGGLDTMAALIVAHYPSFHAQLLSMNKEKPETTDETSDEDLDLLVAILGVLVNLVEKDTANRARLASSSVSLSYRVDGSSELRGCRRGVISLLCSIFLAKQGAGAAVKEENLLTIEPNDEAALRQGQREAENMIVEAYSALLLGFLSTESENARQTIALCLPSQDLKVLVPVLERFVAFHLSLNMISPETHAAVTEVIESCKRPL